MALPAVGAVIGSTIGALGTGVVAAHVSAFLNPVTYCATKDLWFLYPEVFPEAAQLFEAYQKGFLTEGWLRYLGKYHGLNFETPGVAAGGSIGTNDRRIAWAAAKRCMETPLPFTLAFRKWQLGELTDTQLTHHLKLTGYGLEETRNVLKNVREVPSVNEILELRNRGKIGAEEMYTYLAANGYTDKREVQLYDSLRFAIPGPSDLIHFMVRDIWQAPIVNRFNYDVEFPPQFQAWMERQGLGWKPSDQGYATGPGEDITWAQAYWRAHWHMLAPGQAGDAVNRLRPRAPGDPMSRIAGVPAFTQDDYDLVMRVQDYPPIVRQWLLGLSYQPLPVRRLQMMYEQGVINAAELFESFRDWSYTPENATRLVALADATLYQKLTAKSRLALAATARKGYLEGWLSKASAMANLYRASATSRTAQAHIDSLDQDALQQESSDRPEIRLEISVLQMRQAEAKATALLTAVRKSVLRREITEVQTRQILAAASIQPDAINSYIELWNVQLLARGKNPAATQVLTWFKRGAITQSEAVLRLQAFGFNARDSALMIATASQDAAIVQQRQIEKQARTQQQVLRAQAQQLKLADQNRRRIIADLGKSASRSGILKFLVDGYISTAEASTALQQRGILPRDAALWIADALKGKTSGTTTQTQAQQTPTSNGSPAVPGPGTGGG